MAKDGKRNGRILLSQQCSIHGPIETHRHKAFVQNITCKKSEITIFIVGRRYDHDDLTEMMKPCEMCPMCGFGSCRMCGHGSCRMCGHTARKISNNWVRGADDVGENCFSSITCRIVIIYITIAMHSAFTCIVDLFSNLAGYS
ncbi:hypothetical protein DINM_004367 [Dirofilaria immitis]|nr:hypothetical protein [Dirofilaria immitis]